MTGQERTVGNVGLLGLTSVGLYGYTELTGVARCEKQPNKTATNKAMPGILTRVILKLGGIGLNNR